jgi:diguanylate cyclase
VRRLRAVPEDSLISAAIVTLAQTLDMRVVAEGVESYEQLAQLQLIGCDLVQGYYFSRPLPGDAAGEFLTSFAP